MQSQTDPAALSMSDLDSSVVDQQVHSTTSARRSRPTSAVVRSRPRSGSIGRRPTSARASRAGGRKDGESVFAFLQRSKRNAQERSRAETHSVDVSKDETLKASSEVPELGVSPSPRLDGVRRQNSLHDKSDSVASEAVAMDTSLKVERPVEAYAAETSRSSEVRSPPRTAVTTDSFTMNTSIAEVEFERAKAGTTFHELSDLTLSAIRTEADKPYDLWAALIDKILRTRSELVDTDYYSSSLSSSSSNPVRTNVWWKRNIMIFKAIQLAPGSVDYGNMDSLYSFANKIVCETLGIAVNPEDHESPEKQTRSELHDTEVAITEMTKRLRGVRKSLQQKASHGPEHPRQKSYRRLDHPHRGPDADLLPSADDETEASEASTALNIQDSMDDADDAVDEMIERAYAEWKGTSNGDRGGARTRRDNRIQVGQQRPPTGGRRRPQTAKARIGGTVSAQSNASSSLSFAEVDGLQRSRRDELLTQYEKRASSKTQRRPFSASAAQVRNPVSQSLPDRVQNDQHPSYQHKSPPGIDTSPPKSSKDEAQSEVSDESTSQAMRSPGIEIRGDGNFRERSMRSRRSSLRASTNSSQSGPEVISALKEQFDGVDESLLVSIIDQYEQVRVGAAKAAASANSSSALARAYHAVQRSPSRSPPRAGMRQRSTASSAEVEHKPAEPMDDDVTITETAEELAVNRSGEHIYSPGSAGGSPGSMLQSRVTSIGSATSFTASTALILARLGRKLLQWIRVHTRYFDTDHWLINESIAESTADDHGAVYVPKAKLVDALRTVGFNVGEIAVTLKHLFGTVGSPTGSVASFRSDSFPERIPMSRVCEWVTDACSSDYRPVRESSPKGAASRDEDTNLDVSSEGEDMLATSRAQSSNPDLEAMVNASIPPVRSPSPTGTPTAVTLNVSVTPGPVSPNRPPSAGPEMLPSEVSIRTTTGKGTVSPERGSISHQKSPSASERAVHEVASTSSASGLLLQVRSNVARVREAVRERRREVEEAVHDSHLQQHIQLEALRDRLRKALEEDEDAENRSAHPLRAEDPSPLASPSMDVPTSGFDDVIEDDLTETEVSVADGVDKPVPTVQSPKRPGSKKQALKEVVAWLAVNRWRVIDLFRRLDKNGDGKLSVQELEIGLSELMRPMEGLGSSDDILLNDDHGKVLHPDQKWLTSAQMLALKCMLDTNNSGYVEYSDLKRILDSVPSGASVPKSKRVATVESAPNESEKSTDDGERGGAEVAKELYERMHDYVTRRRMRVRDLFPFRTDEHVSHRSFVDAMRGLPNFPLSTAELKQFTSLVDVDGKGEVPIPRLIRRLSSFRRRGSEAFRSSGRLDDMRSEYSLSMVSVPESLGSSVRPKSPRPLSLHEFLKKFGERLTSIFTQLDKQQTKCVKVEELRRRVRHFCQTDEARTQINTDQVDVLCRKIRPSHKDNSQDTITLKRFELIIRVLSKGPPSRAPSASSVV